MLCQSRLHTASETFVRHKEIRIRFDFLRFHIRCMHFDRKGRWIWKKESKKPHMIILLDVQGPLVLVIIRQDIEVCHLHPYSSLLRTRFTMCILWKCVYIVVYVYCTFSYAVTCTAMAQSLVPKNSPSVHLSTWCVTIKRFDFDRSSCVLLKKHYGVVLFSFFVKKHVQINCSQ